MTKQLRNYVVMAICLLGLAFALAYPMVAFGQEATATADTNSAEQLAGLETQLNIERLISQNIDLKFQLAQPRLAQIEQLTARLAQLEKLKVDVEDLKKAYARSQENIKSLQGQIKAVRDKIAAEPKK